MKLDTLARVLQRTAYTLMVLLVLSPVAVLAAASAQRTFASPEEAATALVQAVKAHDRAAALAVLGAGADASLSSGDATADRGAAERFATQYDEKHTLAGEGDKRTLTVGNDDWPFAYPVVKSGNAWHFDTEAGNAEMLARRVGANELAAINVMLAIVDAQRDYASADRNKDGVREYARRFASTPGKKDGLYWKTAAGEPDSPLGPLAARAAKEGYQKSDAAAQPYHGYIYRILTSQGSNAKGGALDYVVRGHMIGGFAVIAHPAKYGNSGVMTFIVNHDGTVYERDLGPQTPSLAAAITRFDPGPGWKPVSAP